MSGVPRYVFEQLQRLIGISLICMILLPTLLASSGRATAVHVETIPSCRFHGRSALPLNPRPKASRAKPVDTTGATRLLVKLTGVRCSLRVVVEVALRKAICRLAGASRDL